MTGETEARWGEANARDLFTYEMLLQHEMEQDGMLWDPPALALTAQAFLLTIALNKDSAAVAVYVSSILGALIAFMSMQLMAKHRFLAALDRAEMHRLEESLGIRHLSHRSYFFENRKYRVPPEIGNRRGAPETQGLLQTPRSYNVWFTGLAVFGVVNLAILATQVLWPWLLHPGP